ncbi:hypothetical protein LSAT2_023096 [Lamellibrachia satsuma]|nr:hypothetical protein LSAT2_023096 [Lamellibrachia satsuma]
MSSRAPPSLMQTVLDGPLPKFVDLPGRIRCVVCEDMLKDPWQTECGHRMCATCLDTTFETAAEVMCPARDEDCVMISKVTMFYDRGTCREILLQPVYCIYMVAGCMATMKWSQLQSHAEKCEFRPVDCSFKEFGCNEKVPRKSLDEHIKHCGYVPVPCSHCHAEVARILRKEHCEKVCPNVIVDCPYKCGKKTLRNQTRMARFDPPARFTFTSNEWLEWIDEFARFRTATKLHKENGEVQRDALLYTMGGREANRIFRTLTFVSPEKQQLITDLSMEKAVMIARQEEQVKSQMRAQLHENVAEARVVPRVTGRYAKDKGTLLSVIDCTEKKGAWFVPLNMKRARLRFKIDTGADITIITKKTWLAMKDKPRLEPIAVRLNSVGGQLKACGQFLAITKHKNTVYRFNIIVIEGQNAINLLSRDVATDMELVCLLEQINASDTDTGIGLMKTDSVVIKLKAGAQPLCITTARRVLFPLMGAVKAELDRMVTSGVIRAVTEPTDWCSAMVPVIKKTGAVRICIDLKQHNTADRRDHFMFPSLEDISPKLADSKVFSTLDVTSGFWQIPIDEENQLLTTFITPFGRYAFCRLPFGISSAPEIFQRKMSALLDGMNGVKVIMDDILVHGRSIEEHDARLDSVIRIINDSGLKLTQENASSDKPN